MSICRTCRKRIAELEYFQRSLLKVLVEEKETEKERQKLRDSIKYSSLGNDKIFYKGMQTDLKE